MAEDPRNPNQGNQQQRAQSSQELGKTLQQQKELNEAGVDLSLILKEVLQIQKDLSKELEKQGKFQSDSEISTRHQALERKIIENSAKNSASLANKLSKYSREDLKSVSKKREFLDTIAKTENDQKIILSKINFLRNKETKNGGKLSNLQSQVLNSLEGQYETTSDILSESEKLKRSYTVLGRIQAPFQGIENVVKSIPIVREAFGELTKMSDKVAETYIQTGSVGKAAFAGVAQATKGLLQTLGNALLIGIIRGLSGLSTSTAKLQNNLNIAQKEASALYTRLTAIAGLSRGRFSFEDVEAAAIGLSAALGSSAVASDQTIQTVGVLTQRLGLSAEQAASLFGFAAATGQSFTGATESIIGQTEALNDATNVSIRYTDILTDVANASAATLLSTEQFPGGIARAAFEARKLGLSLSQLENTQSSLLDFSQSITDEINAELLLGRQLNLDRARYFALTNDLAGLASELYEQAEGFEGFDKLLFPQQQALAKAFGMTRDEAAAALKNRQALLSLEKQSGIAGLAELDREEQISKLVESYKDKGLKLTLEDARVKALEELGLKEQALGAKTLNQQAKAIGATERLENELSNFGRSLGVFITKLIGVDDPLGRIADGITYLTQFLQKVMIRLGADPGHRLEDATASQFENERNKMLAQIRGVQLSPETTTSLQKIANKTIDNTTSEEEKASIYQARETLKLAENLKGVDQKSLTKILMGASTSLGILAGADLIEETLNYRQLEEKIMSSATRLSELNKARVPDAMQNNSSSFQGSNTTQPQGINTVVKGGALVTTLPLNSNNKVSGEIPADDFTIRTNPKDTLVMAGGTKFGEETNKLLERLISAVEKGGSVYLDSRKVGESLVLGHRSQ